MEVSSRCFETSTADILTITAGELQSTIISISYMKSVLAMGPGYT